MIITNDEEALRVECENVLPEEIGELRETLERELNYCNRLGRSGIGLAAPQIGIKKKMAIIRLENNSDYNLDLINCNIVKGFDKKIFRSEGCLSFPGKIEDTSRFQELHIIDNHTNPEKFIVTGLMAVAVQHELDHLSGILFFDHKIKKMELVKNTLKVRPNEQCFCGSFKKFKKCHGKAA